MQIKDITTADVDLAYTDLQREVTMLGTIGSGQSDVETLLKNAKSTSGNTAATVLLLGLMMPDLAKDLKKIGENRSDSILTQFCELLGPFMSYPTTMFMLGYKLGQKEGSE